MVYADEKGVQVFALYGIGDGTEATPLYAVGGKQAVKEAKNINVYMEGSNNDGSTVDFKRWLEVHQHSRMVRAAVFCKVAGEDETAMKMAEFIADNMNATPEELLDEARRISGE